MFSNGKSVIIFDVPVNMKTSVVAVVAVVLLFFLSALLATALSETVVISSNDFQDQTISVCPYTHGQALNGGGHCCKDGSEDEPRDSIYCKSGDFIVCPQDDNCEDSPTFCEPSVEFEGFGPDYDGYYSASDERFENSKRVFILDDKCIWWHLDWRRWIMGSCEDVGSDSGFAYTDGDVRCPIVSQWRSFENGDYFADIRSELVFCTYFEDGSGVCSATATNPLELSSTAGVSAVVQDGTYKQRCKWRYRQNQWRCIQQIVKNIGTFEIKLEQTLY